LFVSPYLCRRWRLNASCPPFKKRRNSPLWKRRGRGDFEKIYLVSYELISIYHKNKSNLSKIFDPPSIEWKSEGRWRKRTSILAHPQFFLVDLGQEGERGRTFPPDLRRNHRLMMPSKLPQLPGLRQAILKIGSRQGLQTHGL
jgi:hypothetical protein